MLVIGPHLSTAKGYAKAVDDAEKMGANTFQFFSRNPRGSNYRAYDKKDIEKFQRLREAYTFGPLQAHAPYTMNLASSNPKVYEFSRGVVIEDIKRMDALNIEYFVLHPGSHTGSGEASGIKQIVAALNQAIQGDAGITVLLETMPGKGSEIGFNFSQLKEVIHLTEHSEKLGICMDLCHVFSAGYDIRNCFDQVLEELDLQIGLVRLKTIHLNDSKYPLGSGKDRHMPLGQGEIGIEAIMNIMTHPCISDLPFYVETPLDHEGHKKELDHIKSLLEIEKPAATNE
ncbi:deoxyribonuclease IV [Anoxybacterium hadale]|uniref:Deoxyribonuclease IV n=1 Tax=Anoxybacterium hadale TaxID=3408580 RepID=A0ACD1A6G9_9FIRM|nr:deoxyribonuclease IV [Clostridiales bacterium]